MKRADLVQGEHYAYATRKQLTSLSGATKVELLSTELHTSHVVRGGPNVITPAKPGERANTGSWRTGPTGLLVREAGTDGESFIAQPANLHMTWTDYQAWWKEAQARADKAAAERHERAVMVHRQTDEISERLARLGFTDRQIRVSHDRTEQTVSNETMLALLIMANDTEGNHSD